MRQRLFLKRSALARISMLLLVWIFTGIAFAQISINVQNKSLRQVLSEIEKVSNFKFFYNESLPGLDQIASLNLSDSDIDSAMKQLLAGLDIEYQKSDNNIIALVEKGTLAKSTSEVRQAQKVNIKGNVVDVHGEAIIGATILEKGNLSNGTITDYDGNFSLDVASDAVLQISYIGYQEIEVAVQGQTSFNIVFAKILSNLMS